MKITWEKVRKYIYDDYGIDIFKVRRDFKKFMHSKFIKSIKTVFLCIFMVIFSGILCASTLALIIIHPITSLIVNLIFLFIVLFMWYDLKKQM